MQMVVINCDKTICINSNKFLGIEVLQSDKRPGVAFAYMDMEPLPGIIMEYIEQ